MRRQKYFNIVLLILTTLTFVGVIIAKILSITFLDAPHYRANSWAYILDLPITGGRLPVVGWWLYLFMNAPGYEPASLGLMVVTILMLIIKGVGVDK